MSGDYVDIELIRQYWNKNPHEYKVSKHPPGNIEYFNDIEHYYWKKHGYLDEHIDYNSLKGKKVLEIGCGIGVEPVKLVKAGAQVTAVDISDFAVDMTKKDLELHNLNAQVMRENGESLEFEDETFDTVLSISSLPYTPNPEKMISEIHRVLKKGHNAYIVVYNSNSWLNLLLKLTGKESFRQNAPVFKEHSIQEIESLLGYFSELTISTARFPFKTDRDNKIHTILYNSVLVPAINSIPKKYLKNYGHHIIAKVVK